LYAPQAITDIWLAVKSAMPQAQLGGITGSGKPGYHSPVNVNRARYPGNYSVTKARDLRGDFNAGRALDITLSRPGDMRLLTQRLINATLAGRMGPTHPMWPVREFFGTVGKGVTGLDVLDRRWVTSDNSHLWHIRPRCT
jgi:hypothetical protein